VPDDDTPMGDSDLDEEEGEGGEWLVTFADMSMLLLTFFILLFSMSTLDITRFSDSFTSVRQALGQDGERASTLRVESDDGAILESVMLQKQLLDAQRKVYSDIRTYMNRQGVEGIIGAVFDEGVITLNVPSSALFEKDEVTVSPQGREVLLKLKDIFIKRNDQDINIRGYTDSDPPAPGSRFADNWEVSALRAVNVLRLYLEVGIEPNRLTATGLADLHPLYPNTTSENKARNRRVEFVLEKRIGG